MKLKELIFALLVTTPCFAGDDDFKLNASLGAMALAGPKYEGADQYEPYYLPIINLEYGPLFASITQGTGVYLPLNSSRTFIIAPAIRWRTTRNLAESWDTFEYIANIRPTATLNTIVKVDKFMFNFRMTDGLDRNNKGAIFNLGATWRDDITDKTNLTIYTTAIYGDKDYNQTYFGITESESIKYGYDIYAASAGLKSVDVGAAVKHFITEHIALEFMGELLILTGAAAKSPITTDRNQLLLGLGVSYNF